jgi:hypothetical protein
MNHRAAAALPRCRDADFPAKSLALALDWQRAGNAWPASKACAFATLLAATVEGICDAAESDPHFSEAAASEFVQDAQVLISGRMWHMDRILRAAAAASIKRLEKSCAAICDAFRSDTLLPAFPSIAAVECVSSVLTVARNVPSAEVPWRCLSACVLSWCSAALAACHMEVPPAATSESCFRVLSLVADAARAHFCVDFLTAPPCVQLVCVCCELQHGNDALQDLCIELLDKILSFCAPAASSSNGCAVPVTGFGSKCSLVWQSQCPYGLSSVQPFSEMLVTVLVSRLLPPPADGDNPHIAFPQVIALNCLRCLNCLLWHDESARHSVLKCVESLARALADCSCSAQTSVRHAAAFVRCTILLRCSDVDFIDNDGLSSCVSHRHLVHVFPELSRLKSSSRPQSSSRQRPLSGSSPAVVSSADIIVFSSDDGARKAIHMHGLMHAALADVLQLPAVLPDCSELACALLDAATMICMSSDCSRAKLLEMHASSDISLWKVLLLAIETPLPYVRVAALQLAAALRHNGDCLAIMSCSSSFVSALRRSVQHLSCEDFSNWDIKAASCACALLYSVVTSTPSVANSLVYVAPLPNGFCVTLCPGMAADSAEPTCQWSLLS